MKKASHKLGLASAAVIFSADALFFTTTDATRVQSVDLIIGFILAVVTSYLLIYELCTVIQIYGIDVRTHRKRIASAVTGVFAVLLALASVGELTIKDLLVIVPMILIAIVYFSYGRSARRISQIE